MRRICLAIGIACSTGCPVPVPSDRPSDRQPAPAPPTGEPQADSPPAEGSGERDVPDTPAPPTRPLVGEFRRALAALHAGDAAPMQAILAPDARWTRPIAEPRARDRDALLGAFAEGIAGPTRLLDLGAGGFAAQLLTTSGHGTLAIVDVDAGAITAVRTYGADPRARGGEPRPPAPTDTPATALVGGRPGLEHVALTKRVYEAASARAWSKLEGAIAGGATHLTYGEAEPEGGADATFVRSFATLLAGPDARLTIRKQHAVADYVLVEAVVGRGEGPIQTPSIGFVDVLRVHEGRIVASWRYLNHHG